MFNISKITSVLLYALMAISVILLIIFYKVTAGIPAETDFDTQIEIYGGILDLILSWAVVLLVLAAVAAIAFPLVRMFTQPKEAIKTLILFAVIAVVVFISYSLSDNTVLDLPGYTGDDNVPGTLKFAGTVLGTALLLFFGVLASIIYAEISKIFK